MLRGGSLPRGLGYGDEDMVVRFPRWSDRSGQVTVELAVVLPVVIFRVGRIVRDR